MQRSEANIKEEGAAKRRNKNKKGNVNSGGKDGQNNKGKQKEKGKHASSTQNRRMVWENVVWPLILEINRYYFTINEYHARRDKFCHDNNIPPPSVAGGFVSLLIKGIISREKNVYSIHYRLIPYMRKRVPLEYGQAIRETNTKR